MYTGSTHVVESQYNSITHTHLPTVHRERAKELQPLEDEVRGSDDRYAKNTLRNTKGQQL